MPAYELAQLNIAHMKAPLDTPPMADFVANLERINALADSAPGFVWRLQDTDGNATARRPFGEHTLVNLSVWTDVQSLKKGHRPDELEAMQKLQTLRALGPTDKAFTFKQTFAAPA
jgi:hypothetical protein